MRPKRLTLIAAALTLLPAAGCGKMVEKATEKATEKIAEQACKDGADGEDCEVDFSEDGATMRVGDGEYSIGENVDYPDGYPDYLKLADFNPMQAARTDNGTGFVVTLVNPNAGNSDPFTTLTGQAERSGCSADEDMADTASQMGVQAATMDCAEGSLTISSLGAQGESEQIIQVMLNNEQ